MRARYLAFVERHDVAWELSFAFLAVVYVAVGFFADEATQPARAWLDALGWSLTAIFAAEFATRFAATYDRRAYLRGHWVDLVALIPVVREIRVLRLLRLLRLVRAFAGVYRVLNHIGRMATHRGLVWLFVSWLGVMVICSLVLYAAEKGVNSALTSPLDAFWWGIVTLTTVGYGDVVPRTAEGKVAATALMVLGIGLFSAITATLTSFLLEGREHPVAEIPERLRVLDELHNAGVITSEEHVEQRREILRMLSR